MDDTRVREIMTSPVLTVDGGTTVVEAAGILRAKHVGSLIVGIVMTTDLARFVPRNRLQMASQPEPDVREGEYE